MTSRKRLQREQVRHDVEEVRTASGDTLARGCEAAPLPLAPGTIALETRHRPTIVKVREIKHVCRVAANSMGDRGVVILIDDTHYRVPDPNVVLRDMREAK
jgi:hypothetical protein